MMGRQQAAGTTRFIQFYYIATPLFLGADILFGLDLRVAFLEDAGSRYAWYFACFAMGLIAWHWPVTTPFIGLLESTINILALCLAVYLPILQLASDPIGANGPIGLSGTRLVGFVLIAAVCIISFRAAQAELKALHARP